MNEKLSCSPQFKKFKFKFLPICRAHSIAVPHPAAFPSAKYTVSPPIFHPTSGYRPGKKKRTCFDAIKIFIYKLFYGTLSNQLAKQTFPHGFGTRNKKRESKTTRKMARIKERRSRSIFRAAKTENPVFAPTPNGNVCYAGYDFYPDLGSDKSSERNFCSRFSEFISRENQW